MGPGLELPVAHNFSEEAAGVVVDDVVAQWLSELRLPVAGAGRRRLSR